MHAFRKKTINNNNNNLISHKIADNILYTYVHISPLNNDVFELIYSVNSIHMNNNYAWNIRLIKRKYFVAYVNLQWVTANPPKNIMMIASIRIDHRTGIEFIVQIKPNLHHIITCILSIII